MATVACVKAFPWQLVTKGARHYLHTCSEVWCLLISYILFYKSKKKTEGLFLLLAFRLDFLVRWKHLKMMLNMYFGLFLSCWLCCSEQGRAAHPQDEAELPGSGPVLQRRSGIVGEKTDSPGQDDGPARQGGGVPCSLPRWEMCKKVAVYLAVHA